jgi:GAF domain-containing protein/HAMP domain-containing protein
VNRTSHSPNRYDRLLTRWGGSYVPRMQSVTQLVSFFAAAIGIYYILVAADLDPTQVKILFASVFGLVALVNLIIPIFTYLATPRARARLDQLYKQKPLPAETDETDLEIQAWQEIITLPWHYALMELLTAYFAVVLPVVLAMLWIGGVTTIQAVHVAIGGVLSGTGVVIQNSLFSDRILAPVRRALLPQSRREQTMRLSLQMQYRLQIVIGSLILAAILMLGPLGYQKLLDVTSTGVETAVNLHQYVIQASIIGGIVLALGLVLGDLLARSVSRPVQEMIRTMDEIQNGNYSQRAPIITSDETGQLTIRLNQLLDQLQVARLDLEQKVEERTADLTHRTLQLQAAAQVAREAATWQDINQLLSQTVSLISDRFGFYHTGIFLLDETGEYASLQAASSEGGKRMLEHGHRLAVGRQGIVGTAAYQNRPHIAMDVGADAVFFKNPDLPATRSEAAIPLAARGKVIGVLDVQSTEESAFTQSDMETFQTLADQIAVAIQNARLIEESQNVVQQLMAATAENIRSAWRERVRGRQNAYRYTSAGLTPTRAPAEGPTVVNAIGDNHLHIPIVLRGVHIGEIALQRKGETEWSETDRSLAAEISNQVGLALENARLLDDAQRRAAQEQSLSDLSARLSRSLDPGVLLQTAIRELHQLPNVSEVATYLAPPAKSSPDEINRDREAKKS